MTTIKKNYSRTGVYQACWKKAQKTGFCKIHIGGKSKAHKVRFALYDAVKAVKKGEVHDPELLAAVESCSISVTPAPEYAVLIERFDYSGLGSKLEEALEGFQDEELAEAGEVAVSQEEAESYARFEAKMNEIEVQQRREDDEFEKSIAHLPDYMKHIQRENRARRKRAQFS